MIRLSVVGMAACGILSACSNHQPAGYGGSPGGWSPGVAPKVRTVAEPKILPETFYAAGQLFEAQGLLTKAAVQYRKAAAVNHTFAAAYDRLGVTLGRLGKHPQALEALQTAVKLGPESAPFHNNLAFQYVLLGRWTEAEGELLEALALEPNFDRAHINLGVVLANLERYVDAVTEFRIVVAEADAYYNLGLVLRGQHRYADAASAFEHVISLNYEFWAAHVQLEQIGPKLDLANALEPRMTIPFETMVEEAATEVVEQTHPVTESPVVVMETEPDADVVPGDPIPAQHAGRNVMFSTVDGTADRAMSPADELLDDDWDCPNDDEWSFPADSPWPFLEEYLWTTPDIDPPLYDLDIECPADTAEAGAVEPKKMIEGPSHPAEPADPAKPSKGGQASVKIWKDGDWLEMPEPEWYRRAVGQTDGAE